MTCCTKEKRLCFIRKETKKQNKNYDSQQKARLLVFNVLERNIFVVFFKAKN